MGFDFTMNEWLVVGLVFLLGLVLGGALFGGGGKKHRARYDSEHRRANELQAENDRLRKDVRTSDTTAARAEARAERADARSGI